LSCGRDLTLLLFVAVAPAGETVLCRHNPNSKKSQVIAGIPNVGLCQRCHDIIEWRKKFRKYKPIKNLTKWCASIHLAALRCSSLPLARSTRIGAAACLSAFVIMHVLIQYFFDLFLCSCLVSLSACCGEKKVRSAYHLWCTDCAKGADCCPKCLQNRELVQASVNKSECAVCAVGSG